MAFATSFVYEAIDKITPVLKEMEKKSEKLEEALKDAMKNPKVDAEAFEKALKDSVTKPLPKIKRLNESLKKTAKNLKSMSGNVKAVGTTMSTHVTAPVLAGFASIILAGGSFEDSLASLSSITGLQGQALKSLSKEILTTSANFGIASTDIAGGMELIGSKQPALLKTPKLLMEVTRAAATLSKASGQDLTTTAGDLLDVMNTFEIGGDKAAETVNVLAAASKFGAAQVPFVTAAMKNAGAMAKLSGVSMAELVASIEIMSEKTGLAAEVVGTGLQSAFKNLEKGPDKFRPSVIGLQKALENMNAAGMDSAEMEKVIGGEAVKSFSALIANAGAFKTMTKNIQGTTTAEEQAAIRMNTFNESAKRLWQNIKNNLIRVFMDNKDILKELVDTGMDSLKWITAFIRNNKDLVRIALVVGAALAAIGPILFAISAGMSAYATAMTIGSAATGAFAISAKAMTAAAVPMAAPILALVAALTLLYKTKKLLDDEDTISGISMLINGGEEELQDSTLYDKNTAASSQAQIANARMKANRKRIADEQANKSLSANAGTSSNINVNVKAEGQFTSNGEKAKKQSVSATAEVAGQRGDR